MEQSDEELLAAVARGDVEAFGQFYRRHARQVLGYAIARCHNPSDVADVVADTFLAVLSSAGRYRSSEGGAVPWLLGIARHTLARQRRSFLRRLGLIRRTVSGPIFSPDETEGVDAAIDAAQIAPELNAALAGLRTKDRELLLLVGRDGLSPAQAGAALGMNANTARLRLSRTRKRLRLMLPEPIDSQEASDANP
jgi:RNA polymerase sigma-70 factor, ECF subfamily